MKPLSEAVARVRAAARKAYDLRGARTLALDSHPICSGIFDVQDARDMVTVSRKRKLSSSARRRDARYYLAQPNGAEVLAWAKRVVELDDAFDAAWEEFEAAQKAALTLAFGADAPLFGREWDAGFAP